MRNFISKFLITNKTLQVLLFLIIYFSLNTVFAQNKIIREDNKLTYKETESYKSICFKVEHIINTDQANSLINLLKTDPSIFKVSFDIVKKECRIDARLEIDKNRIINLTGPSGYKVYEYTEQVNLLIEMPKISYVEREKIESDREEQNRIINNWPDDFPQFINTGNPAKDNEDYKKRKDAWIKNNPEKYKTISSGSKHFESEKEKKDRQDRENIKK